MKVWFDTVGCLKNFADSDMAMGIIGSRGHEVVSGPEQADVIIVNTCGFIEDAKRESIDEIFSVLDYKKQGKKVIVTGCMVQRYAAELFDEIEEVDAFLGVNDYDKLPDLLDSLSDERSKESSEYTPDDDPFLSSGETRVIPEGTYSTYLRISEGCDRNCSYCVIPRIRGPYRSKPIEDLVREAKRLADSGTKELVVIAEDTGYYGIDLYGKPVLAELLRELCKVSGIEWIRVMYCYEDHITDELIDTIASEDKICDYIDIPLQHGSDRVLKAMNRKTTRKRIEETIDRLRMAVPDIAIRTTFISGFPGETWEDHEELMDLIEKERFARVGVFKYSGEEGTPSYDMPEQIDEDVKEERRDALMLKQLCISLENNRNMIGKTFDVIVDGIEEDGAYTGRTRYDAPDIDDSVIFESEREHAPGDIVNVLVEDAFDYDLKGREVYEPAE